MFPGVRRRISPRGKVALSIEVTRAHQADSHTQCTGTVLPTKDFSGETSAPRPERGTPPGHRTCTHAVEHRHRPAHPRQNHPSHDPLAHHQSLAPHPSQLKPLSASAAHATAVTWPTPTPRRFAPRRRCAASQTACICASTTWPPSRTRRASACWRAPQPRP